MIATHYKFIFLLLCAVLLFAHSLSTQQKAASSSCIATYENHNQTDYGSLIVQEVKGTVLDPHQSPIRGACVGIFTENEHRLVATIESGEDGGFRLSKAPPGHYRLVVSARPLCVANVPLLVVKRHSKRQQIQVHMKPHGLDSCSYGRIVEDKNAAKK